MSSTRGSFDEYWLAARSVRATTSLFLASTSTCASSDSVHDTKFQAASGFSLVDDTPTTSPPTNVDSPPSGPGIGATPMSMLLGISPSVVEGIGMTPMWPLGKNPVQVGPCSSLAFGITTPARNRSP